MKLLRQIVFGNELTPARSSDYADAIEFQHDKAGNLTVWTIQNNQRVSGLLVSKSTSFRISLVESAQI